MKDLSDYIVKDKGSFHVDVTDMNTNEPLWRDNEPFYFFYNGTKYVGAAKWDGMCEVERVYLVPE